MPGPTPHQLRAALCLRDDLYDALFVPGGHHTVRGEVEGQAGRVERALEQPHDLRGVQVGGAGKSVVRGRGGGVDAWQPACTLAAPSRAFATCLSHAAAIFSRHASPLQAHLRCQRVLPARACTCIPVKMHTATPRNLPLHAPSPPADLQRQHVLPAVVADLEDAGRHLFVGAQVVRLLAAEGRQDGALGGTLRGSKHGALAAASGS